MSDEERRKKTKHKTEVIFDRVLSASCQGLTWEPPVEHDADRETKNAEKTYTTRLSAW